MKIGLDLDGVLYPWHEGVYTYFRLYKNYVGTDYRFWTEYWPSLKESTKKYVQDLCDLYYKFIPDPEMMEMLKTIGRKHELFYVTSRPESARTTTEQYLKNFKFPHKDNLILCKNKALVCRDLPLDVLVDDMYENLKDIPKTTIGVLLNKSWNADYQFDVRITNVVELESLLNLRKRN